MAPAPLSPPANIGGRGPFAPTCKVDGPGGTKVKVWSESDTLSRYPHEVSILDSRYEYVWECFFFRLAAWIGLSWSQIVVPAILPGLS